MIAFPYAKINLGLHVVCRRQDGYHGVETVLVPVGLWDILEVIPASDGTTRMHVTGLKIPPDGKPNLCLQAYELLCGEMAGPGTFQPKNKLPPVHIHLHKNIPPGSGLGGGSSDATFMLLLLNKIFALKISAERLAGMASRLGSDCAFFLKHGPMLATGRGNILRPAPPLPLKLSSLVIVVPPIHIDTGKAYARITPKNPVAPLHRIIRFSNKKWGQVLMNDFEPVICKLYPLIDEIKTILIQAGAWYASMSGSGSAVYGFFSSPPPISQLKILFPDYMVISAKTNYF